MGGNLPTDPEFARLTDPRGEEFEALLGLYEEAIAARERKGVDALRAMIALPQYKVVIARISGQQVGFAILLIGRTIGLLEYMAVDRRQRGGGIGSALYRHCRDTELAPHLPLLIEVDSDREATSDQELRGRRKQFYLRLGCKQVIGLHYILPLGGSGSPPLMDLLADGAMLGDFMPKSLIAEWLTEIYELAYDCSPSDSRLAAMLDSLPDVVPLR